ncbi:MAG: hypothetical protein MI919_16895 [Holophagales bacterium]|nr:hypothetical protein [Holophagales bacterium]
MHPAARAQRAEHAAWPRPRAEVPIDPRARLQRALRLGHRPTVGMMPGAVGRSRIQRGKEVPVSKDTKSILGLGDEVIGHVKGMTKDGAANQQQTVDELEKEAESERQELARIAYSRTTDFYNKLGNALWNIGPASELGQAWDTYFMNLGFEEKAKEGDGYMDMNTFEWISVDKVCTFRRSDPLVPHFLTAYAVIKMGGAVCAQYAPLTALMLAEKRPDLKIEIGSGGGHAFALATGKDDTIVVDPWAYAKEQKAHLLDDLKDEFQPEKRTVINTGDEEGLMAGKTVPTLEQFFNFMEKNLATFAVDSEKLDQDSKPANMDWNVPTTISGDIDYVEAYEE